MSTTLSPTAACDALDARTVVRTGDGRAYVLRAGAGGVVLVPARDAWGRVARGHAELARLVRAGDYYERGDPAVGLARALEAADGGGGDG